MTEPLKVAGAILVLLGMGTILYISVRDGIVRRDVVLRGPRVQGQSALIAGIVGICFALCGSALWVYLLFFSGRM